MFSKKHKQMIGMTSTDVHIDVVERSEGLYESGLFVKNPVQLTHFQPTFSYGGTVMNATLFHQVRLNNPSSRGKSVHMERICVFVLISDER